jgi:hypothetical protein
VIDSREVLLAHIAILLRILDRGYIPGERLLERNGWTWDDERNERVDADGRTADEILREAQA